MSTVKFQVEGHVYELTADEYAKSKLLTELTELDSQQPISIWNCSKNAFELAYNFLKYGTVPSIEEFFLIEYFGLSFRSSYGLSCLVEDNMRANMYALGTSPQLDRCLVLEPDANMYALDEDNKRDYKQPYYGLYTIDKHFWTTLACERKTNTQLLFDGPVPTKATWEEVQRRLNLLSLYLLPGVVIAGGAIFSILFGQKVHDIDLFIYGKTEAEAEQIIRAIAKVVELDNTVPLDDKFRSLKLPKVSRSRNAVTFHQKGKPDVQVILRLYQTQSEIVSGFDVDSCCLGWDGKCLFGTYRGVYALENLTNTVNFDRLSPSYERRMIKYASRGIAIFVPNLDRSSVNTAMLDHDLYHVYPTHPGNTNIYSKMKKLRELNGLSVMLLLERFAEKICYRERLQRLASRLSSEVSDYCFASPGTREGETLRNFLEHIASQAMEPKYFDSSDRYVPLLRELHKLGMYVDGESFECYSVTPVGSSLYAVIDLDILEDCLKFRIAHPLLSKSCYLIQSTLADLEQILHFPQIYHDIIATVRPVDFPANIQWKKTLPGEQMTNTFHRIVLEDNSKWYESPYYASEEEPPSGVEAVVLPWEESIENFTHDGRCFVKHRTSTYAYACGELLKIKSPIKSLEIYKWFSPQELTRYAGRYDLRLTGADYKQLKHNKFEIAGHVVGKRDFHYANASHGNLIIYF